MNDAQEIWSVYMVRESKGRLYTGVTTDPLRRFAEHQSDGPRCARFLRGKGPLQLVLVTHAGERSSALRLENKIKRLSKSNKERLITAHHAQDVAIWRALNLLPEQT